MKVALQPRTYMADTLIHVPFARCFLLGLAIHSSPRHQSPGNQGLFLPIAVRLVTLLRKHSVGFSDPEVASGWGWADVSCKKNSHPFISSDQGNMRHGVPLQALQTLG